MTAGRPTKYNQKLIETARDYIITYDAKYEHAIPSIAGLSLVLNISRETIHAWDREGDKVEFSDILRQLSAKQEQILISKGLKNEFNSNIVKLALGKHGYHDKQETDHKSSDGTMSPPQVIEIVAKDQSQD